MKVRNNGWAACAAALLLLLSAGTSWSRDFKVRPISEESYTHLSPEARVEYDRAYYLADRIVYTQALDAAERAIELQPSSVELRYFAIRLASFLAEVNLELKAIDYLERAGNQCEAILAMEDIPPTLRDRVRADLNKFHDRAENIYRREELRKTWGTKVAKEYVRSAYRKEFEKEKEERMKTAVDALRDPEARRSLAAKAAARALAAPEAAGGETEESTETTTGGSTSSVPASSETPSTPATPSEPVSPAGNDTTGVSSGGGTEEPASTTAAP